jgi:UDP-N-acetylmuramate dehydrogenase
MDAGGFTVQEQVPLAPLTTLQVGGRAQFFTVARQVDAVESAVAWARERAVPLLVMGGGSNLLIADEGFPGLVLRVAVNGVRSHYTDGIVEVTAGAGENWHGLVTRAVANGWSGVECLAGIPGTVGATPIQNVGAYGQEVGDTITHVEAFDLATQRIVRLNNAECNFSYRDSRFKRADRQRFIILTVTLRLRQNAQPDLRYDELRRFLHEQGLHQPQIADIRRAVLAIRKRKSMLLDGRDPNARSAGSFFVNPILTLDEFARLEQAMPAVLRADEQIPAYLTHDGRVKVSAAWLIEHVGFTKGYAEGCVGLSSNHTLALINRGQATAREIIAFAQRIRQRVYDAFGILLVPEPSLVGVSLDGDTHHEEYGRVA